jgi:hypothetical protein
MRHFIPLLALIVPSQPLLAQVAVDTSNRITYRLERPTITALQLAKKGLPVFYGELLLVSLQRGDTIAELIARVRNSSWKTNSEVWLMGNNPGARRIPFGRLQNYLRGDQRFRILVLPAWCEGCEGDLTITFLPYADTTGYLVQGRRTPDPR